MLPPSHTQQPPRKHCPIVCSRVTRDVGRLSHRHLMMRRPVTAACGSVASLHRAPLRGCTMSLSPDKPTFRYLVLLVNCLLVRPLHPCTPAPLHPTPFPVQCRIRIAPSAVCRLYAWVLTVRVCGYAASWGAPCRAVSCAPPRVCARRRRGRTTALTSRRVRASASRRCPCRLCVAAEHRS